MFYEFNGIKPVAHPSSFIHPQAIVTGNVIIGKDVYIGPGCALRGDWGKIIISDGCNVQENCTIHMFPGITVLLKESAHIGHGAIIHGATIGKNCLVGAHVVVAGYVNILDGVTLWGQTVVNKTLTIGENAVLLGRTGVSGDLPGNKTYWGAPAQEASIVKRELVWIKRILSRSFF